MMKHTAPEPQRCPNCDWDQHEVAEVTDVTCGCPCHTEYRMAQRSREELVEFIGYTLQESRMRMLDYEFASNSGHVVTANRLADALLVKYRMEKK